MDDYCIFLGTLLDKPSLRSLQYPDQHSVHCLVEVDTCVASGYNILAPPASGKGDYSVAAKLDSAGNALVVAMGKKVGICGSCSGTGTILQGLRVTAKGKIDYSTKPPTLQVTELLSATVPCSSKPTSPTKKPPTKKPTIKVPTKKPTIKVPTKKPTIKAPTKRLRH